jgi:PAS domain S-box-containing protein
MIASQPAQTIQSERSVEQDRGRRHDIAAAIALVLAAALLQGMVSAHGLRFGFATFYPAVTLAALYGGVRAGWLATFLSAAIAGYSWSAPPGSLSARAPIDLPDVAFFVANGLLVSWVVEKVQHANLRRRQAEGARRVELERLIAARTIDLSKQIVEREAAEVRMRLALEATESGIWEWTLATGRAVWSESVWRLFGLDAAGQEASYELWRRSIHPDDRARVTQAIGAEASAGQEFELFWRVNLPAGAPERWLFSRGRPVMGADGEPERYIGIVIDITERKQAEDALLSSEKMLKAFLVNSALIAWLKDDEGRYVFMSENFQRRAGLRLEDALGRTDFDLFPPAVAEHCRKSDLAAIAAEAAIESLEPVPNPDGSTGWWLNNKFTYRDSSGRRYVGGLGVDITARIEAEAALRKSEQRLQRFYNSGLLGLFYWNMNGQIVDANDKFLEMVGYARDDLAAGRIDWRHMVSPAFERLDAQSFAELMAIGVNSAPFEQEYVRKDGSRLPVLFAAAMLDETRCDGVSFVVDITERRQAQQDLLLAKAEAERANLAKSKFLAAASHDLRQPLQSLTALLRVIEMQIANGQNTDRAMRKAQGAVNSLNGLLRGILDIARLDAGVVDPVKTSVDLGEMLMRLADEYGARAAEAGLALRFAPRALRTHTDPTLLERIVRNLIENALRYTSAGGVLLGLRRRGACVRLDVIDTGIGVPADKQGEIFQEFHQLDNPGRDASRGLGLGLAIVARLARLLDLEVDVRSRLRRGTRFSLLLPLEQAAPAPVETRRAVLSPGGRILVIDDNVAVRESHEALLDCMGYEVFSADTGEGALALAEREGWRFDAILADYRLGAGLTGIEAATEIFRRAGFAIPTLVLTGDTAVEPILELSSTAFTLLHKPADPDELLEILASLSSGEGRFRGRSRGKLHSPS